MKISTIAQLREMTPFEELEKEMIHKMINFIDAHENPMDQKLEVGHLTGSAWIVNKERTKALFTYHTKLGMWLQLGGHAEVEDESIKHTAIREAYEESGLESVKLVSEDILSVDIHMIPGRNGFPDHLHYDIQFLFEADENETLVITSESNDLKWISLEDIPSYNNEKSIMRMLEKGKIVYEE
ncbi:MAG: NUDIX hydrolase [Saprospiraceae bacterium]|jgi:8-oxo-dGTP pyrophosphatase MutT (NUDIX family)|nr:NUDIX hydrolase [Saprospiraceae bacterium]